jgi:hypothetical protein
VARVALLLEVSVEDEAAQAVAHEVHALRSETANELLEALDDAVDRARCRAIREARAVEAAVRGDALA